MDHGGAFLVIEIHRIPELWFGWIFGALALGITLSAQLNRRLLRQRPPDVVMRWGAALACAAAAPLMVNALTGFGGLAGILLPLFPVACSLGLVSTNAMAGALAVDPSRSGSVAAIVGTGQFLCAGLVAWLTGHLADDLAVGMAAVILACAVGTVVVALVSARGGQNERQRPV